MEYNHIELLNYYRNKLKESEIFNSCSTDLITILASNSIAFLHQPISDHTFHSVDVFNSFLLSNSLPVPDFLREKLLEITEERIKKTKKTTFDNLSVRIKKDRIKSELLGYMNKLVIAGASVERASEIVVLSNKNDFDGKPVFKASTLEKIYPKYASELLREESITLKDFTRRYMEAFSKPENIKFSNPENTFDFWEKIIEETEGVKIPAHLKGNRRE
ncbi:hypothetical protein LCGC14_1914220 [marine sediment metagenome]|uniref:Uncharacterized protein n=1 Tax=marine sediment metagenome TaxID=412755 RepID=A0A0F9IQR3_9ZZZZ